MDTEISSEIEHKMDFETFSFFEKKKKKDVCLFLLIPFWLLAKMVFSALCLNYTKHVSRWKVPPVAGRAILPEPKESAVHVK